MSAATSSGALIDLSPAAPLLALHQAIRQAVHAVRGAGSTGYRVGKAHISLGYATAETDSDPWQRRLRRVDPNGAPLRLDEVHLVEVGVDQAHGQLWWSTIERFTLASD